MGMYGELKKHLPYCGNCGTFVKNQKYCGNCGSKLDWKNKNDSMEHLYDWVYEKYGRPTAKQIKDAHAEYYRKKSLKSISRSKV
jgi:hypothetical protein